MKEPGTDAPVSSPAQPTVQPRQKSPTPARPGEPVSVQVGSLTHTLTTLGSVDHITAPFAPLATVTGLHSPASSRKTSIIQEGSDREMFGDDVLKEFKTQVSQSPAGASSTLRRNSAKSSIDELLIPPPPTTSLQEELELLRNAPERYENSLKLEDNVLASSLKERQQTSLSFHPWTAVVRSL